MANFVGAEPRVLTSEQQDALDSIVNLPDNAVPKANNGQLESSGTNVDPTLEEWIFDKTVNVPPGSLRVGEVLALSEGVTDLVISNLIKETFGLSINANFDDATGSAQPFYVDYGSAQQLILQSDDTQVITTNPINFSLTGSVVAPNKRLVDRIILKTNGAITNFRVSITDNASGLVVRYIPNKRAFDSGVGGLDLGVGTNTFFLAASGTDTATEHFLGIVPFLVEDGQLLDGVFVGDTMDMLGNASDVPYFEIEAHDGPPRVLSSGTFMGGFDANDALYLDGTTAVASSRNSRSVIKFPNSVTSSVVREMVLSSDYTDGNSSVFIRWTGETATSGDVVWGVEIEFIQVGVTDLDSDSFATQQTIVSAVNGTSGIMSEAEIPLTKAQADNWEAGGDIRVRISRLGNDGSDSMSGIAEVKSVSMEQ